MNSSEIKRQLLLEIDRITQNDSLSYKALDFLQDLRIGDNTIGNHGDMIGKQIRQYHRFIVPVVCDDMFEYISPTGESHSINDFICISLGDLLDDDSRKEICSNSYYGITLYEQVQNDDISSILHEDIKHAVEEGRIRLKDCVKQFLIHGNFPLIITTFGFPVIENCFRIVQTNCIYSEWYHPNGRNDLPLQISNGAHTVYHIFGGESSSSWAYNEPTLLKYVHSLHDGDYRAKALSHYLCEGGSSKSKRLLVLGSTLPDWLFRFFVYPMYEDSLQNTVGYWLSLKDVEKGLGQFLERNKYSGQTNLIRGNRVEDIMREATPIDVTAEVNNQKQRKIFVSYKREPCDSKHSQQISVELMRVMDILRKQGMVWYDLEQVADGGNAYWTNIKRAIRDCDIFFPLVTKRYLNDFQNVFDIESYSKQPLREANEEDANDVECVTMLPPVVREAYYALAYHKKCVPIIIVDDENLSGGEVEAIAKNKDDSRNLPKSIFGERTMLVHNDKDPVFFEFKINECS